jgi:hypothetical protein
MSHKRHHNQTKRKTPNHHHR